MRRHRPSAGSSKWSTSSPAKFKQEMLMVDEPGSRSAISVMTREGALFLFNKVWISAFMALPAGLHCKSRKRREWFCSNERTSCTTPSLHMTFCRKVSDSSSSFTSKVSAKLLAPKVPIRLHSKDSALKVELLRRAVARAAALPQSNPQWCNRSSTICVFSTNPSANRLKAGVVKDKLDALNLSTACLNDSTQVTASSAVCAWCHAWKLVGSKFPKVCPFCDDPLLTRPAGGGPSNAGCTSIQPSWLSTSMASIHGLPCVSGVRWPIQVCSSANVLPALGLCLLRQLSSCRKAMSTVETASMEDACPPWPHLSTP
mmetsp:Transcript_49751/g.116293  ORF Transcript_49751/g.116293 Transcript_49751/m.116293 type:complete len:315 (-) Transcript_49751:29-973(-)